MKAKEILKITGLPVLFASMCCLSPVIFFLLGITSLSVASELADIFYGDYKWYFRGVGFLTFVLALIIYFRSKGICTLDKLKKQRNKVLNTIVISLISLVLSYIFFLYVVVHYVGVFLELWK